MSPRKRKRSQAPPESDNDISLTDDTGQSDSARLEKERDVWEVFREEHFEVVEQMPMTLHRQYTLMRELEQQANHATEDLLPILRRYISRRQELEHRPHHAAGLDETNNTSVIQGSNPQSEDGRRISSVSDSPMARARPESIVSSHSTSLTRLQGQNSVLASSFERANLQTTREMLSQIAWLTEELLRTSDEKVNLAQAACDSVDRHVRILDQAITEQEASIAFGARPGHLSVINLPDLAISRWPKYSRASLSPVGDEKNNQTFQPMDIDSSYAVDATSRNAESQRALGKRGRPSGRGKRRHRPIREGLDQFVEQGVSLKITLPAHPGPTFVGEVAEETFCHCNRVSFGQMIGCDNSKCEHEWFHLDCIGLTEPPEGRWFCSPECEAIGRRKRK